MNITEGARHTELKLLAQYYIVVPVSCSKFELSILE